MPVIVKAYYGINHKNRMFPTMLCPYLGQFTVARAALDSQLYQHPANPSDSHRSEGGGAAQRGRWVLWRRARRPINLKRGNSSDVNGRTIFCQRQQTSSGDVLVGLMGWWRGGYLRKWRTRLQLCWRHKKKHPEVEHLNYCSHKLRSLSGDGFDSTFCRFWQELPFCQYMQPIEMCYLTASQ